MTSRKKQGSALGRGLDALIRPDIEEQSERAAKNEEIEDIKEAEETDSQTNKSQTKLKKPKNRQKTQRDTEDNTQKDTKDTKNDVKTSTQDLDVDEDLMERVMLEVGKNPRISLWSAKSAAVLRYLKNTKPAFSISKEASALIEAAVKDKYPDLWELFEKEGL
ncbi:hypothetical protein [Methanobacterium paludis]|uniref:AAA ATPase n=1 Tax=Methanobacterium paludis (strain DSM 25820 / JCM 18151 / SWAN1) TaxID=868131 RepID=F6D772_METPW|nr:hypothetical protein [Methanobacterium paludis]AEG17050.1 AAA ATPase [Methanobacterium paludis]